MAAATIVWFRLDLRLSDNPALHAAAALGGAVIPLYIWSPDEERPWQPGGATKWWLHHSLEELAARLEKLGSPLVLRSGSSDQVLEDVARECGADAIYWNRRYEPHLARRDDSVERKLSGRWNVATFNSALLREPDTIATKQGTPFQVFTPYWKACIATEAEHERDVFEAPRRMTPPAKPLKSEKLSDWKLLPRRNWADHFREFGAPGELGAGKRLSSFLNKGLDEYEAERNRPDHDGVSRFSAHLHFGELSPREVRDALRLHAHLGDGAAKKAAEAFLRQLYWREFAHHLLHHFPHTDQKPLREQFAKFPWTSDAAKLRAWQRGQTGFPIVDAGMRQLWRTGWMHNRVRMIVASFLVKDLLLSWQAGAAWFWDTLVDADLANNSLGWQWTAGCGADAAPYFRVFNPTSQGEKFDPEGDYVRRYVPELAKLPTKWIHRPEEAPADVLAKAGVALGRDYPRPIVDHGRARDAALAAWRKIR